MNGAVLLLGIGLAARLAAQSGTIDVRAHGAAGDGIRDDSAALQEALDQIGVRRAGLHLPCGRYVVSNTLRLSNQAGFHIHGAGAGCVEITPTSNLAGKPVLMCVNCRDGVIERLTIRGLTPSPPAAAIEFRAEQPLRTVPTHMTVRDVILGSLSGRSLRFGIRYTGSTDANNDNGHFENVTVQNFAEAAYSFEHSNSLAHKILGGAIDGSASPGTVAVRTAGGSFTMIGSLISVLGWDFDVQPGEQRHPNIVVGVSSEGASGILRVADVQDSVWLMSGYMHKGAPAGRSVTIDFRSANGRLHCSSCEFNLGQETTWKFAGTASVITFVSSGLNPAEIEWEGQLAMYGNYIRTGKVRMRPGPAARLMESGSRNNELNVDDIRTLTGKWSPGASEPQPAPIAAANLGECTVRDLERECRIRFDRPQPDLEYRVIVTPAGATGKASPASARVNEVRKTREGFTVAFESAPGRGRARSFDWIVVR